VLFVLYLALKYLAYSAWCLAGLAMLRPGERLSRSSAMGLGFLRLLLGFFVGLGIWYASSFVYGRLQTAPAALRTLLTYLAVYVPVRWLEWSVLAVMIEPPGGTLLSFFAGRGAKSRLFRLGGILVSCLADVPMLVDGLPVGRFLC